MITKRRDPKLDQFPNLPLDTAAESVEIVNVSVLGDADATDAAPCAGLASPAAFFGQLTSRADARDFLKRLADR